MGVGHRWLTPAGLGVVALVVFANAASSVGLGTRGPALVISIGLLAYVAAAVAVLLWSHASPGTVTALLLVMAGASVATHHGDPTGTGGIGLYLGMLVAPLRLDHGRALAVAGLSVLAFDLQLVLEAADPLVFIVAVDGGCALFFLLGRLLRSESDQRTRADLLVEDLRRSQDAERAAAAEAERARLAREIHDVLAHTLSGLVVQLDAGRYIGRQAGVDPEVQQVLDRAHGLAVRGCRDARQAVSVLRGRQTPGPDAIPELVADHERLPVTGRCSFSVTGEPVELSPDAGLALFRTAQEALSNVAKHAPTADVDVVLQWREDATRLEIVDSGGTVAAPSASGPGYGLVGMGERARSLGGHLVAEPRERGFAVALDLPRQRRAGG
jgi:signal transduction histidine kinase